MTSTASKPTPASASASTLTLVLTSVGNPDLGQYVPVSKTQRIKVATAGAARQQARDYIEFWGLGGGNWGRGAGDLVDSKGRVVARVRYNGRVVPALPSAPNMDLKALTAHMMAESAAEFPREATAADIIAAFEARQ